MFKRVSDLKVYLGLFVIIFSSLGLIGCPKKVSPVVGSEGIAGNTSSKTPTSINGSASIRGNQGNSGGESSSPGEDVVSRSDTARPDEHVSRNDGPFGKNGSETPAPGDEMASLRGTQSRSDRIAPSDSSQPLTFSDNVYFDFDVWSIRSDAKNRLTENARWLVSNSNTKVQIEGHGDERGTNEYNLALGERRARSTKRYLVNLGVAPSRISFISYGEEKSVCDAKTEHCFQKNRRAHFVVKK